MNTLNICTFTYVSPLLKVKHLEHENKKLETKLKILKEHEEYGSKIDDIVKHLENELEEQVENLIQDQEKLKDELLKMQEEVEDTKKKLVVGKIAWFIDICGGHKVVLFLFRYENEMLKKAELENEFILTKKVN